MTRGQRWIARFLLRRCLNMTLWGLLAEVEDEIDRRGLRRW